MEEFPRSLWEFDEQFATEQDCRDYLFRLRWQEGFRCPRCSGSQYWQVRSVRLEHIGRHLELESKIMSAFESTAGQKPAAEQKGN